MSPAPELSGEIYIDGAVNNPGVYPFGESDTIASLIQAAGNTTPSPDTTQLNLHISDSTTSESPQKIDINRAEPWLLEALPGIGPAKARAIADYRQKNGGFHHINELTKVDGISLATYEQIKHLVTVND